MRRVEDDVRRFLVRFLANHLPKMAGGWWDGIVIPSLTELQQKTYIQQKKASRLEDLDVRALLRVTERNWIGEGRLADRVEASFDAFNHIKAVINAFNKENHRDSNPVSLDDQFTDLQTLIRMLQELKADEATIQAVERRKDEVRSEMSGPNPSSGPSSAAAVDTGIGGKPALRNAGGAPRLITPAEVTHGMNVGSLIQMAIESKRLITWGAMHEVMFGGPFQNNRINEMIRAAHNAAPGADALLVDKDGKYSPKAPVKRHFEWLRDKQYFMIPNVKSI